MLLSVLFAVPGLVASQLLAEQVIVVWISPTHSIFQAFRWDESLIVTWPVSFPEERGAVSSLSFS